MSDSITFYFPTEQQMLQFGQILAKHMQAYLNRSPQHALVIYLNGELGAGKTTLTRSIVREFGHTGNVKSPTYTLVEEYQLAPYAIYHFDLYRLSDPEELEFMGIRDYFRPQTVCLLEWASRGKGMIPEADIIIQIDYAEEGRNITLLPQTAVGTQLLVNFNLN
ncbi:tRNA (adenosine(37)-N6)-threonylcarbamoyltransferase complex ATPase subunit type 1 TsaE [Actinobacillus equuli subsp. equuli]|nr:tRNA (adenosine(37)-N6)-threonylcarbamoyltransferase complex ATPase subunit type 1 TsaE [Actinobacillus equuli]AIZ79373.1 ATP-binding protein [Actinobacillus equuli subsp. equuli]MDG4952615.1 tRNA (adenosine(37)-N6)-threonylcarbamoyltransferase complex ATPase subunit type 1 TsaE [Actinobacillus equuli subsp. equuli]WGE41265.1 tRNA (adenosine(37)-N6)-threonylcarbamoyltransferase complex ATPase subunit type 1 TsaE [Actinobacillus equuli subsp. haemolyticus]WGE43490.1 tRNA (adenosine(37)-N6)-th